MPQTKAEGATLGALAVGRDCVCSAGGVLPSSSPEESLMMLLVNLRVLAL